MNYWPFCLIRAIREIRSEEPSPSSHFCFLNFFFSALVNPFLKTTMTAPDSA